MIEGMYQGEIQTPMGVLKGNIMLETHQGRVQGYLEAMGSKNRFEKIVIKENQCEFSGKIPYFLGTIHYVANAEIQQKRLQGMVKTNLGEFKIIANKISE